MARAPKPFEFRGQWRAQVTLKNGQRPSKDFKRYADACAWLHDQLANADTALEPVLGGPRQASLAQALEHYAHKYSVGKGGVASELNRINHYLQGADLPLLKVITNAKGGLELVTYTMTTMPAGWVAHLDAKRLARAETYACIHRLANKRCSAISTADIRELFAQMGKDGLSASTIQKEIALLKSMFNSAAREWEWKGFANPCLGIKLGKSERRFVHITEAQKQALSQALSECDNPYVWPLVFIAKETTLRLDSLMKMRWDLVDVENRTAMLPSKTGQRVFKFSTEVTEVLRNMPHDSSGRVFPMSKNAVKMAWQGVRIKADLPTLQFRDLRHLGATDWARRGLDAHSLQQVLGHSDIKTAQFYIDLNGMDLENALDRASARQAVYQLPPQTDETAASQLKLNRTERLRLAVLKQLDKHDAAKVAENSANPSEAMPQSLPGNGSVPAQPCEAPQAPVMPLVGEQAQPDVQKPISKQRAANVLVFRPRK